jgi:transposase
MAPSNIPVVSKYQKIWLLFLPPYSHELNPAEKIWSYFKDRVSMIAYNSLESLQQKISEITSELSPDLIKSISGNQFYK